MLAELRELARSYAPDAIKELARLATNARSEMARIAASRELLDRGYGKSTQYIADHEEPATETSGLTAGKAADDSQDARSSSDMRAGIVVWRG